MVATLDDKPAYALNLKEESTDRIEVPCTATKIVLSQMANKSGKQTIYGYVEFKSDNFYSSEEQASGEENLQRVKFRDNMKIYFKSEQFNSEL